MNIAFFYNLSPGGAKRVVYEEIKYLKAKLHSVDVYLYETTGDTFMPVFDMVDNVYRYFFKLDDKLHGISKIISDFKTLIKLNILSRSISKDVDRNIYDVFIVHPDRYTQSPCILRFLKTPTIYFCEELLRNTYEDILDVDNTLPIHKYFYEKGLRRIRRYNDRKNAQSATLIMTASDYIRDKVESAYKSVAVVNRLGVDTDVFHNRRKKKDDYLLFIGQKEKVTGYVLAKQVADILKGKYDLKVIDHKSEIFVLSDNEMANIYSKAFLTLCTSYNEPFGLAAIESMACGTPVLAVNEGGYKESVVDGVTGYLLPRNARAFAKKIVDLKTNPSLYKKISVNCVKSVKDNWSWEEHGKRLEEVIKQLIKKPKYDKH